METPQPRRGATFFPRHTILGGRLLSYLSSQPASLAKTTARSKTSCRSASPRENTLLASVNRGLPKGRPYPFSELSFRGKPNRSSAAMGSSRSTGNCDRSSPRSPTTPHPTSTPTPSSITPRRNHETKPPRAPLSAMHQSNHTTHRTKRNPSEKTRPTTSHENKPHRHDPPVQPAKSLVRPHVTMTANKPYGFEPIQTSPTLTHGSSRTLILIIRSAVSLSAIKTPHSRRGLFF